MHAAASLDDVGSVRLLLGAGADVQRRTGIDLDETALDEALRAGSQRVVALLQGVSD